MSINVFKKHPGNKITFSDRSIFFAVRITGPKVFAKLNSVGTPLSHVLLRIPHTMNKVRIRP